MSVTVELKNLIQRLKTERENSRKVIEYLDCKIVKLQSSIGGQTGEI